MSKMDTFLRCVDAMSISDRSRERMMAEQLISIRISKATGDKLRWLAERHGTQTEAIAVALDRLYESDYNKERTITGDRIAQ